MQISKSRLLVVSLLLIIGVQPAVPRNINNPTAFHPYGNERTPPLPPFNRGNPPCNGNFQYVNFPAESNLDENQTTRRSHVRVGDTDIHEWRSRSSTGGRGFYVCQDSEGITSTDYLDSQEVGIPCLDCYRLDEQGVCQRDNSLCPA